MTAGLIAVLVFACGLFLGAAACAGHWLWHRAAGDNRKHAFIWAAVLGIAALCSRLLLSRGMVSWTPYLDQWSAEVEGVVRPLAHGRLGIADMLAANNEHRVVLTRIVTLLFVLVDGRWANFPEACATFVLQAAALSWFAVYCRITFQRGWWLFGCAAMALPLFLVCDWENLVLGFQNQFGFLILGSVVAFSLASDARLGTVHVLGLAAVCVLLLGSMASGMLTSLSIAAVGILSLVDPETPRRRSLVVASIMAAIFFAGLAAAPKFEPGPELRATGSADFVSALVAYGAWPLVPLAAGLVALWLPWIAFMARAIVRRRFPASARFVAALGAWVLLQTVALALYRAGISDLVRPRYTDVLCLAFVANTLAVFSFVADEGLPSGTRRLLGTVAAVWFLCIASREAWISRSIYRPYFEGFRRQTLEYEAAIRAFATTGNKAPLRDVSYRHVPYEADKVLSCMEDPATRALLPIQMDR